ncbi:MAG: GMP synthase (glutamine-hydrolyzing), partial [Clostridia bacterium]|nr:GMP synthase (glutamine-hydrolyzing) [Clostridia bacterium]
IMGEATPEKLEVLREADAIFRQEVEASGQGRKLWQHFAMLCPNPIDGSPIVCLRAVHASDGSKAMPGRLPYDLLERTTARILDSLPVSRVLYDLTPSTHYTGIQWQ